jgi:hypothetical protein
MYVPAREKMRERGKNQKGGKRNFLACENAVCIYCGKIINNFMGAAMYVDLSDLISWNLTL